MKIFFQENAIKYETEKAMLVAIPKSHYKVWIPKSLVKPHLWFYGAYIPANMTFSIVDGKKKSKYSAQGLVDRFQNKMNIDNQVEIEYHTPQKINPKKVEVDESLKR